MKFKRNLIILLIIILIATSFYIRLNSRDIEYGGKHGISATASSFKIDAAIYYLGGNQLLVSEVKNITVENNDLVKAVFEQLKQKPEQDGIYSVIDQNCKIISADIFKQKLYLNVSKEIINSSFWKQGQEEIVIYSLVNSMTQFDSIDRMQLKIDGKDVSHYYKTDLNYTDLSFNPAMNEAFTQSPEGFLSEFLNVIKLRRYEQAYAMILNPEQNMPDEFKKMMDSYNDEVQPYAIAKISTEKEDNIYFITILYRLYDEEKQKYYNAQSKLWQVVELSKGNYRIIWQKTKLDEDKLSN